MGDYCDSTLFKTRPLFTQDELALQITLFYDDLEVCNALGSKAKIHKLGKSYKCIYTCSEFGSSVTSL